MNARHFFGALLISAFSWVNLASAQVPVATPTQHHKGDGHHAEHMERMRTELGLSDAQAGTIEAIHAKYRPKLKALREQGKEDPKVQAEIKELRQAEKAEVDAVLTPEQQAKMKELHHAHKGGHHNPEMQRYHKQVIEPVLKAQRLKLESALQAADKAAIADLRARMQALHAQKHDARKSGPDAAPSETEREAFHAARKAIMAEAEPIALRYKSEIEALRMEIQPQIDQWEQDMAVMEGHEGKGRGKQRGKEGEFQARQAARFLLLDPFADKHGKQAAAHDIGNTHMQVFPNPATTRTTLRFQIPQATDVTVELIGQDGRVLKELAKGQRTEGEHFIDLDTQDLPAGTYLFRMRTGEGARVKAFSVVK